MKKFNVIIVDDEPDAVATIELIINEFCPELTVLGSINQIDDAWELIKKTSPDLVFLDIDMPRGSGFDLLERFPIRKFDVIFITAFSKYTQKMEEYGAFGCLLKPIDIDVLTELTDKLIEFRKSNPDKIFKLII